MASSGFTTTTTTVSAEDYKTMERSLAVLVKKMYPNQQPSDKDSNSGSGGRDYAKGPTAETLTKLVLARASLLGGVSWLVSQVDEVKNTEIRLSLIEDPEIWTGIATVSVRDPIVMEANGGKYATVPTFEEMKSFVLSSEGAFDSLEAEYDAVRKDGPSHTTPATSVFYRQLEGILNRNNIYYFYIKRLLIVYKEYFCNSCNAFINVDSSHFLLDEEEVHPSQILQYMPLWSHLDPWASGDGNLLGSSTHASGMGVRKDDETATVAWKGRNFMRYDLKNKCNPLYYGGDHRGSGLDLVLPLSADLIGDRIRYRHEYDSETDSVEATPVRLPRSLSFPVGTLKTNRSYDRLWNFAVNPTTCRRHLKERLESIPHTSLYRWHSQSKLLSVVVSRNRLMRYPLEPAASPTESQQKPEIPPTPQKKKTSKKFTEIAAGMGSMSTPEDDDDDDYDNGNNEVVMIEPSSHSSHPTTTRPATTTTTTTRQVKKDPDEFYDPSKYGGNEILVRKRDLEPVVVKEKILDALWKELETSYHKGTVAHFNVMQNGDVLCILEDAPPIFPPPSPPPPAPPSKAGESAKPTIPPTATTKVNISNDDAKARKEQEELPQDSDEEKEDEDQRKEREEEEFKTKQELEKAKRRRRAFNVLWYRFESLTRSSSSTTTTASDVDNCIVTVVGRFYFADYQKEGVFFSSEERLEGEPYEGYPVLVRRFTGKEGGGQVQRLSDEQRYMEAYTQYLIAREKKNVEILDAASADPTQSPPVATAEEDSDDAPPPLAPGVEVTAEPTVENVASIRMKGKPKALPIVNRILSATVDRCALSKKDTVEGLKLSFSMLVDKSFRVAEKRDVLYEEESDNVGYTLEEEEEELRALEEDEGEPEDNAEMEPEVGAGGDDDEEEGGEGQNITTTGPSVRPFGPAVQRRSELERRRMERLAEKKRGKSTEAFSEIGVKDEVWSFTMFFSVEKSTKGGHDGGDGEWISPYDRLRTKGMICTRINEENFRNAPRTPLPSETDLGFDYEHYERFPTLDDRRLGRCGEMKLCMDSFTPCASHLSLSSKIHHVDPTKVCDDGKGRAEEDEEGGESKSEASTVYHLSLYPLDDKNNLEDTVVLVWTESYASLMSRNEVVERIGGGVRRTMEDRDDDDAFYYKLQNPFTSEGGRTVILGRSSCPSMSSVTEWDPYREEGKVKLRDFSIVNVQSGSRMRFGGFDSVRSLGEVRAFAIKRPAESMELYRPPVKSRGDDDDDRWWNGRFDCDKVWMTRTGGIAVVMEPIADGRDGSLLKVFRLNKMSTDPGLGIPGEVTTAEHEGGGGGGGGDTPPRPALTLLNVTALKDRDGVNQTVFYGTNKNELGSLFETREHIVLLVKQHPSLVERKDDNKGKIKVYVKMWKSSWTRLTRAVVNMAPVMELPPASALLRVTSTLPSEGSYSDLEVELALKSQRDYSVSAPKMLHRSSGKDGYHLYEGKKKKKEEKARKERMLRELEEPDGKVRLQPSKNTLLMMQHFTSGKCGHSLYPGKGVVDEAPPPPPPPPQVCEITSLFHDVDLSNVCVNPSCNNTMAEYLEDKYEHARWYFCSPDCQASFYQNLPALLRKGKPSR